MATNSESSPGMTRVAKWAVGLSVILCLVFLSVACTKFFEFRISDVEVGSAAHPASYSLAGKHGLKITSGDILVELRRPNFVFSPPKQYGGHLLLTLIVETPATRDAAPLLLDFKLTPLRYKTPEKHDPKPIEAIAISLEADEENTQSPVMQDRMALLRSQGRIVHAYSGDGWLPYYVSKARVEMTLRDASSDLYIPISFTIQRSNK